VTPSPSPPSRRVRLTRWRSALSDVSGQSFDDLADAGVSLEGTLFSLPIVGRDLVWRALSLLESLHDEVSYLDELVGETSIHFPWEGHALGVTVKGVTSLSVGADDQVSRVILHHRPLGAVLLLAATLADRLPPARNGNGNGHG
jgi:hypothetical protein